MNSRTRWTSRTVIDTQGTAGSIVLSDEGTAQRDLEDWLHDYYETLDADDMTWIVETVTGVEITYEDNEQLIGAYGVRVEWDSEWSAERSAEAIYEYLRDRGEPVTKGRTSVSLGMASLALGDDRGESGDEALAGAWCRCGDDEGWITDEADIEIAAEYLRAVAHEN